MEQDNTPKRILIPTFYSFICDYIKEFGEQDMKAVGYKELYRQYKNYTGYETE